MLIKLSINSILPLEIERGENENKVTSLISYLVKSIQPVMENFVNFPVKGYGLDLSGNFW